MLREMWLNIGIEKTDTHKGITVKVLLYSSTTKMFICYESVRNMQSRNGVIWSRAELLQSGRELTTKVGNNLGLSSYTVP